MSDGNSLKKHGAILLFLAAFLLLSLFLLKDYGIVYDSPKNFKEGEINLDYLLSFKPLAMENQVMLLYQIHGALFFMLSELSYRIFHASLGWADPVSARHLLLPFLMMGFLLPFFLFAKKHLAPAAAWVVLLMLCTQPRLFGHMFNNIKDISLFVFFSLAVMCFFHYLYSGKRKLLYAFFLSFSLAFSSKTYAVLIPAILACWIANLLLTKSLSPQILLTRLRKDWPHYLAGTGLCLLLIFVFYLPALWGIRKPILFLGKRFELLRTVAFSENPSWNFYSLEQIAASTPVLTLLLALTGIAAVLFKKGKKPIDWLLLWWLAVPVILPCTPFFNVYGGLRLFMVFYTPFILLAGFGIERLSRFLPSKKSVFILSLGLLMFSENAVSIARMHPYETASFNFLAGGLAGAQKKQIPYAYDDSLQGYRGLLNWLNQYGAPNANVIVINADSRDLLDYYPLRKDFKWDYLRRPEIPRNSYLLVPVRRGWPNLRRVTLEEIENLKQALPPVYQIRRDGAEISTVYYRP